MDYSKKTEHVSILDDCYEPPKKSKPRFNGVPKRPISPPPGVKPTPIRAADTGEDDNWDDLVGEGEIITQPVQPKSRKPSPLPVKRRSPSPVPSWKDKKKAKYTPYKAKKTNDDDENWDDDCGAGETFDKKSLPAKTNEGDNWDELVGSGETFDMKGSVEPPTKKKRSETPKKSRSRSPRYKSPKRKRDLTPKPSTSDYRRKSRSPAKKWGKDYSKKRDRRQSPKKPKSISPIPAPMANDNDENWDDDCGEGDIPMTKTPEVPPKTPSPELVLKPVEEPKAK